MKIRKKFAIVAAAVAVTTLTMAVIPVLMASSSTIVQSAWAQEVPGTDTDTNNLIEQYNVPNASDLVEEHTPTTSVRSDPVAIAGLGEISGFSRGVTFLGSSGGAVTD